MKCLVIIPTTMHNYSFSAPLTWMFSKHTDKVTGIYGFELTEELVKNCDFFIIELNWFIELFEFRLLAEYIKKKNKNAKILFGGLYAALKYKEIFQCCDVDYFIQGDNELPIEMFLEGEMPAAIPNFLGKNFENPVTYTFKEEDYQNMEFNLDWFPSYFRHIEENQMYQLPMVITSKGGCSTIHKGCDYCMGAKTREMEKIYHRPPVAMSNNTLMNLLGKVEKKFESASLLVLSRYHFDFSGRSFDLNMNVEIDSPISIEEIGEILNGFKKCLLNISVYEDGLCGEVVRDNYDKIIKMEDKNHKIQFFTYEKDAVRLDIPEDHILHAEDVLPGWTHWDYYSDMEQALIFSEMFYYKLDKNKKFGGIK